MPNKTTAMMTYRQWLQQLIQKSSKNVFLFQRTTVLKKQRAFIATTIDVKFKINHVKHKV